MAEVYFAGDGHLGHRRILKYRPEYNTIKEHDEAILKAFDHVTKRDKTFFTGDWVFEKYALDIISQVRGDKHLVLGNHDRLELMPDMLKVFNVISGDFKYKEFWVTHIPIHPDEMRGKMNIYAHTHNSKINDWRYFCTSMEQINYKAVSLQEIRKEFAERKEEVEKIVTNTELAKILTQQRERDKNRDLLDIQAIANSQYQGTLSQWTRQGNYL